MSSLAGMGQTHGLNEVRVPKRKNKNQMSVHTPAFSGSMCNALLKRTMNMFLAVCKENSFGALKSVLT